MIKECDNRIDRILFECQKQLNILKEQKEEYEIKINEFSDALNNKEANYNILAK